MKCDIIMDLLPSYIDGLTSDASNEVIEEHIKTCVSCRQDLEEMQKSYTVEKIEFDSEKVKPFKKVRRVMRLKVFIAMLGVILVFSTIMIGRSVMQGTNEKNIVAVWTDEAGGTLNFLDEGVLEIGQEITEAGLVEGTASYYIYDIYVLRVNQGNNSAEFFLDISKDELELSLAGEVYNSYSKN